MIAELKYRLIKDPQHIENLLNKYEFSNIKTSSKEIRCGIKDDTNSSSVRIKLLDNKDLFVQDFGRSMSYDLINYIIKLRKIDFKTVIQDIKTELGIEEYSFYKPKKKVFDGFYDNIKVKHNKELKNKIYPNEILNQYENVLSLKFLQENISLESQKIFNVMYDLETQRIIFPIYDWCGNIIGVKGRANWEVKEYESKYLYLIPCSISNTLYGFHLNYTYLQNDTVVLFEAEKSIMQCHSYGFRNALALLGNSLSDIQCRLILSLNLKKIIFAYDEGLDMQIINKNIQKLKMYTKLFDIEIGFWDWENSKYICKGSKNSISDMGQDIFFKILEGEIKYE